jgi:hypothetical protein
LYWRLKDCDAQHETKRFQICNCYGSTTSQPGGVTRRFSSAYSTKVTRARWCKYNRSCSGGRFRTAWAKVQTPVTLVFQRKQPEDREVCILDIDLMSPTTHAIACPHCGSSTFRHTRPTKAGCYYICTDCSHMWHVTAEVLRASATAPSRRRASARKPNSTL